VDLFDQTLELFVRWEYTGISWGFGPRGAQWGSSGKKSQEGPGRGQGRGVRGKAQAKIPLGEGFGCFLGETTYILAGSEMQVPSFFDFQQIGQ